MNEGGVAVGGSTLTEQLNNGRNHPITTLTDIGYTPVTFWWRILKNETNVVLQDVGTFYWQISAFKCNFGPICGL